MWPFKRSFINHVTLGPRALLKCYDVDWYHCVLIRDG